MSFYGRQAIIKFQILIISVNTWQVSLGTAESSKDVETEQLLNLTKNSSR